MAAWSSRFHVASAAPVRALAKCKTFQMSKLSLITSPVLPRPDPNLCCQCGMVPARFWVCSTLTAIRPPLSLKQMRIGWYRCWPKFSSGRSDAWRLSLRCSYVHRRSTIAPDNCLPLHAMPKSFGPLLGSNISAFKPVSFDAQRRAALVPFFRYGRTRVLCRLRRKFVLAAPNGRTHQHRGWRT